MDSVEHKDFDELHAQLMTLLDRIEMDDDPTLASQRFDIMESFGYKTVAVASDPNAGQVH